jgi:hypothetical protein
VCCFSGCGFGGDDHGCGCCRWVGGDDRRCGCVDDRKGAFDCGACECGDCGCGGVRWVGSWSVCCGDDRTGVC